MDLNSDEISMLDRDYQNALQETQRYWENRLITQRADKNTVMESMVDYPKAGISIDDTPQEAAQKAAKWAKEDPEKDWQVVTVGDTLYRVDPQTGKSELMIAGEAEEEGEPHPNLRDLAEQYKDTDWDNIPYKFQSSELLAEINWLKEEGDEKLSMEFIREKLMSGELLTERQTQFFEKSLMRIDPMTMSSDMLDNFYTGLGNQFSGTPTDNQLRSIVNSLEYLGQTREGVKSMIVMSGLEPMMQDKAIAILGVIYDHLPTIRKVDPEKAEEVQKQRITHVPFEEEGDYLRWKIYNTLWQ